MTPTLVNHGFMDHLGPEQAWFAGLMAADGCIQGPTRFRLTLSEADWDILDYVRGLIAPQHRFYSYLPLCRNARQVRALTVCSRVLVERLAVLNVVPRKTLGYVLPDLTDDQFQAFLRGFMDGDGCVGGYKVGGSQNYLQMSFYCANPIFAEEVRARVSMHSSISYKKRPGIGAQVYWSGKHAIDLGRWLYSNPDLILSRKAQAFRHLETQASTTTTYGVFGPKREIAKQLFSDDMPIIQIAQQLGVNRATVFNWRNRYNWEV